MVSQEIRDAGLMIDEAKKMSLQHTKEGLKVTFLIQPDDMPTSLYRAFIGKRYRLVLVEIGDDEQPVPQQENVETRKLVTSAALMCREIDFQKGMLRKDYWEVDEPQREQVTADELRDYLGISSRGDLAHNEEAQAKFKKLRARYLEMREHGIDLSEVGLVS